MRRSVLRRFRVRTAVLIAASALLLVSTSGCVYFNVTTPLDENLQDTTLGAKTGVSQAHSILGLVAWGNAGTDAAAKQGGITTIRHADQENFAILGFVYNRYRTVVYGD